MSQIKGTVSAGGVIMNDYTFRVEDITGGHRLTIKRGSDTQVMDIMDHDLAVGGTEGQVISFDAEGKPVAVDLPPAVKTVNGATPDANGNVEVQGGAFSWNDLPDKPFEDGYDQLLLDLTETFVESTDCITFEAQVENAVNLTPGNVYTVYVNDERYTCTALDWSELFGGMPVVGLGYNRDSGVGDESLPFRIMIANMAPAYIVMIDLFDKTTPMECNVKIVDGIRRLDTVTPDDLIENVSIMRRISDQVVTSSDLNNGFTIKCTDTDGKEVIYTDEDIIVKTNDQSGSISLYMPYPDLGNESVDEYELVEIRPHDIVDPVLTIPTGVYIFPYSKHSVKSFTINGYTKFRKVRKLKPLDAKFGAVLNATISATADGQWSIDKTYMEIGTAIFNGNAVFAHLNVNGAIYVQTTEIDLIPTAGQISFVWNVVTGEAGNYTKSVYAYFTLSADDTLTCLHYDD